MAGRDIAAELDAAVSAERAGDHTGAADAYDRVAALRRRDAGGSASDGEADALINAAGCLARAAQFSEAAARYAAAEPAVTAALEDASPVALSRFLQARSAYHKRAGEDGPALGAARRGLRAALRAADDDDSADSGSGSGGGDAGRCLTAIAALLEGGRPGAWAGWEALADEVAAAGAPERAAVLSAHFAARAAESKVADLSQATPRSDAGSLAAAAAAAAVRGAGRNRGAWGETSPRPAPTPRASERELDDGGGGGGGAASSSASRARSARAAAARRAPQVCPLSSSSSSSADVSDADSDADDGDGRQRQRRRDERRRRKQVREEAQGCPFNFISTSSAKPRGRRGGGNGGVFCSDSSSDGGRSGGGGAAAAGRGGGGVISDSGSESDSSFGSEEELETTTKMCACTAFCRILAIVLVLFFCFLPSKSTSNRVGRISTDKITPREDLNRPTVKTPSKTKA